MFVLTDVPAMTPLVQRQYRPGVKVTRSVVTLVNTSVKVESCWVAIWQPEEGNVVAYELTKAFCAFSNSVMEMDAVEFAVVDVEESSDDEVTEDETDDDDDAVVDVEESTVDELDAGIVDEAVVEVDGTAVVDEAVVEEDETAVVDKAVIEVDEVEVDDVEEAVVEVDEAGVDEVDAAPEVEAEVWRASRSRRRRTGYARSAVAYAALSASTRSE